MTEEIAPATVEEVLDTDELARLVVGGADDEAVLEAVELGRLVVRDDEEELWVPNMARTPEKFI